MITTARCSGHLKVEAIDRSPECSLELVLGDGKVAAIEHLDSREPQHFRVLVDQLNRFPGLLLGRWRVPTIFPTASGVGRLGWHQEPNLPEGLDAIRR